MEEEAGRSGREHFERALQLRGDDAVLLLHYGSTLALASDAADHARGVDMLRRASRDDREPWTRLVALLALAVVDGDGIVGPELRGALEGVAGLAHPRMPLLRKLFVRATGNVAPLIAALADKLSWAQIVNCC